MQPWFSLWRYWHRSIGLLRTLERRAGVHGLLMFWGFGGAVGSKPCGVLWVWVKDYDRSRITSAVCCVLVHTVAPTAGIRLEGCGSMCMCVASLDEEHG